MLTAVTGRAAGIEKSTSWKATHTTAKELTIQPTIDGNLNRAEDTACLPATILSAIGTAYPSARPCNDLISIPSINRGGR